MTICKRVTVLLSACVLVAVAACADRPVRATPPAGLKPCPAADVPPTTTKHQQATQLNIAARKQAAGHPPEGWCGETAIQEALLHHGAWIPQKQINAAGNPVHPDLYASDVPVALRKLGARIEFWRNAGDLDDYIAWLRGRIDRGIPVLAGVKINPTGHPEWGLDHFVLAAGASADSIIFNTTWGTRISRTNKQLHSRKEKGFAFANGFGSYYGISIPGLVDRENAEPRVRLFATGETDKRLTLVVKCEGLRVGASYRLERTPTHGGRAESVTVFRADGSVQAFHDTIDKSGAAIYRCRLLDSRGAGGGE